MSEAATVPTVQRAGLDDLDVLAPLFDQYRGFYEQPSDEALARRFLSQRLERNESVVLLARLDGQPAGFTQLYPTFSSVRAARVWVLNDLFVAHGARRRGVAQALIQAAAAFARGDGAIRLELETMPDNRIAQTLYEAGGWQRYDGTLRYHLPLT
jgi:GNAT superfamily N-acetyltransferase